MLTLMAAWQAMLAAMLVRILSRFSDCSSRSNCSRISCSRCSTSRGGNAGGRGLHRDGARAERLHLEAIAVQLVGDLGEDRHLSRRQLDDQRHQQLLLLRRLRQPLLADFLEQNALVRHVLVDDPQPLRIDREDERVANLSDRLQRRQRLQTDRRIVVGQNRGAAIAAARQLQPPSTGPPKVCGSEARHWNGGVALDGESAAFELQRRALNGGSSCARNANAASASVTCSSPPEIPRARRQRGRSCRVARGSRS